jgi:hypothetical protein
MFSWKLCSLPSFTLVVDIVVLVHGHSRGKGDQMLVGDRQQTSTKSPKGYLHWQMVWWMKGLMNHPILKAATDVGLLRTHTRGSVIIKVEWISCRQKYATVSK